MTQTDDFIIIKKAVSSEVCEILSNYACLKARLKPNKRQHDALKNVHREYGDPLMETLLEMFTPLVEEATGLALWPTLSFYYTYQNGQQLTPHKDRSSCQFVAGLCIGADNEFKKTPEGWPLILNQNGQPTSVALDYGDLIIFKGHETEHWREIFSGEWFVSAIFGYVDQKGPFSFQKYDQRKQIGQPHVGMFNWLLGCLKNKTLSWLQSFRSRSNH